MAQRADSQFVAISRTVMTWTLLLSGGICLTPAFNAAQAQLPQIRLNSTMPQGGQVGTTVEVVVVGGTDIDDISAMSFSHAGITAVQKTQDVNGQQQPVANTFLVTIDPAVPVGVYDLRVTGAFGISNPRTFVVGTRPEVREAEPNNDPAANAQVVELNTTITGRSDSATDLDYYKFTATAGQRILFDCNAKTIDSRMQPRLEIHTPEGKRLAHATADIMRDPLLDFAVPADGEYLVKVFDVVYSGSADHFYRLTIHTGPHIDFVIPSSGLAGTTGTYSLYGRNLPNGQATEMKVDGQPLQKLDVSVALPENPSSQLTAELLDPVMADADGFKYIFTDGTVTANPMTIFFATAPTATEVEPNNTPAEAQTVTIPIELTGQSQIRGDIDWYQFTAKAQEVYYVEVFGQRNGISLDPYFVLEQVTVNDKGEETVTAITTQDDNGTNLAPNVFDTVADDPVFRFVVPADGNYRVSVRDKYFETRGDPRLTYRLAIRQETPDYRLVVLPLQPVAPGQKIAGTWSSNLRRGDNYEIEVLAFRRDGFNGPIDVNIEGLPEGVVCRGTTIGPNQTSAVLVLTATEDAAPWSGTIQAVGNARIDSLATTNALAAAKAAIKPATDALVPLIAAEQKANEALAAANAVLAEAKKAAEANKDDAALAQKATEAQAAVDAAAAALKTAQDARVAQDAVIAQAHAKVAETQAAHDAAAKYVSHPARGATIAWSGAANVPGTARTTRSIELAVLDEPAFYQLSTDVFRIDARQGHQILVPVALAKRQGFNADVPLTFVGMPGNANITVENKPIPAANTEMLYRLFVNNNTPPGVYTLYLKSQAAVSYRRHLDKLIALQQQQPATNEAATKTAEALTTATTAKDEAVKKATEAAEAAKKAQEATAAAEKELADAQTAATAAAEKAAEAKKAADGDANNQDLAKASEEAAKAAADADTVAKTAAEKVEAAKKVQADAEAAAKAAEDAKVKAEADLAAADAASKAAAAAKTDLDAKVAAAEKVSTAANINVFSPSTPIIIDVKPSPVTLAAAVPDGGALKKGGQIDIKVTVSRINGFQGPVQLTFPIPPGYAGLTSEFVTIPADQAEGVVSIRASADATEGALANLVIRAVSEFDGRAEVDVPVAITVSP
ncbi:MAG: hypothetical protein O3A29_06680 [Planctomycetota bacterium]|nr:hypothetical protein [Planctomycetota bacterium]